MVSHIALYLQGDSNESTCNMNQSNTLYDNAVQKNDEVIEFSADNEIVHNVRATLLDDVIIASEMSNFLSFPRQ